MSLYICSMCGHVSFTEVASNCPVCHAPKEKFIQNDKIFQESAEKSKEGAVKHIPTFMIVRTCGLIPEQSCTDVNFRVGATLHPMEEAHRIQFADCYIDGKWVSRQMFSPGVFAAGCFHVKGQGKKVTIVENCNLHGYWMAESDL